MTNEATMLSNEPTGKIPNRSRAKSPADDYAGNVRIVVTSLLERPTFEVAKTSFGPPRAEFVSQTVLRLFGQQADGEPHKWLFDEQAQALQKVPKKIISRRGVKDPDRRFEANTNQTDTAVKRTVRKVIGKS
jgi:hypothetical protein